MAVAQRTPADIPPDLVERFGIMYEVVGVPESDLVSFAFKQGVKLDSDLCKKIIQDLGIDCKSHPKGCMSKMTRLDMLTLLLNNRFEGDANANKRITYRISTKLISGHRAIHPEYRLRTRI